MARTCPDGHLSSSTDYCDVCGLAIESSVDVDPGAGEAAGDPPAAPASQECPNCSAQNPPDALFCEACGYDYTTGTMPRPVEPLTFPLPGSMSQSISQPASSLSLDQPGGAGSGDEDADSAAAGADEVGPTAAPLPSAPPRAGGGNPSRKLDEPWVVEIWIDPDWYAEQGSADRMPSPGLPTVVLLEHSSSLIGRASRSRGIDPEVDISGDPGVSRRHANLTTDGSRWFIEDLGSANGTFVGAASQGLPSEPIEGGDRREIGFGEQIYLGAWTRLVLREAAEGEF